MKHSLLIILTFFTFLPAFSQTTLQHQNMVWVGYYQTLQLNEKFNLQTELQSRILIDPNEISQCLLRMHLHRKLGNKGWDASIGASTFLTKPSNHNTFVPEYRPHLEIAKRISLSSLAIDQRLRAEARFYQHSNSSTGQLEDGVYYNNIRYRYRIQISKKIKQISESKSLKAKIGDEIHLNLKSKNVPNKFEQNRLYAGLTLQMNQKIGIDLMYIYWYQRRRSENYISRDIISFNIIHTL